MNKSALRRDLRHSRRPALLAGCADDTEPDSTVPTVGGAARTSSTPEANVAACVVGQWRSTGLAATPDGGTADADLSGGAGFQVTIGPHGGTMIIFDGMQPITYSARVAEAEVSGEFFYSGRATGTVTTDSGASPGPSPDTTGTWRPVGDIDWDQARLTVDLKKPVSARLFDKVELDDYTGDGAERSGDAVDIDPFFDNGRYTCGDGTLTVTPGDDGDLPIVMQRT